MMGPVAGAADAAWRRRTGDLRKDESSSLRLLLSSDKACRDASPALPAFRPAGRRFVILPLLLAAAVAAPLQQQTGEPDVVVLAPAQANQLTPATLVVEPAAMFIVACDADGDGRTSRAELTACIARTFATVGSAGTGSIGYIAYADWQVRWLGSQGALPSPFEVDRDGDNRITLDEVQRQFSKLFSRYDRDGDGAVTRAEALTIRAVAADDKGPVVPQTYPKGKRPPPPKGERVPGGQPPEKSPIQQ